MNSIRDMRDKNHKNEEENKKPTAPGEIRRHLSDHWLDCRVIVSTIRSSAGNDDREHPLQRV